MLKIIRSKTEIILENWIIKRGYYNDIRFTTTLKNPVYLVEYPKSGVTYLSCLLANYYSSDIISFFNVNQYVCDIHINQYKTLNTGKYSFVKSHAEVNNNYGTVIHLVRDPIEAMVSYYNYYTDRRGDFEKFSNFIRSRRGCARYNRHVDGWLNCYADRRYVPIAYSRLVANPEKFIDRWVSLNSEKLIQENLDKALLYSSKTNMLCNEKLYRSGGRLMANFIGEKKFKIQNISSNDLRYIKKKCGTTFEKFNEVEGRFYND